MDDPLEREADQVADAVVSGRASGAISGAASGATQRKCAACEVEEEKPLQRKCTSCEAEDRGHGGSAEMAANAVSVGGVPLTTEERSYFEPRFGRDFSDVRIHADGRAAAAARSIDALAYTTGRDIAFGAGQYRSRTPEGRRLLAHELTHVVHQTGGAAKVPSLQRQPAPGESDQEDEPALTRAEEKRLSRTSPGAIAGTAEPLMISLNNFAIDRTELKSEHEAAIKEIAGALKYFDVVVIGHTDASGEPPINDPISKGRALAVRRLLERQAGVSVQAMWFGEDRPTTSNDTIASRSRNRRVDIYIFGTRARTKVSEDDTSKQEEDVIIEDDEEEDLEVEEEEDEPEVEEDEDETDDEDGGEEDDTGEEDDDDDDDDGIDIPNPCAVFPRVCAEVGKEVTKRLFCKWQPEICELYDLLTEDDEEEDDDDKEPEDQDPEEEERTKKRVACPISVDLPEGVKRIDSATAGDNLRYPFDMRVKFRNGPNDEDTRCDCNCGEYRQYVAGYFQRDGGTGTLKGFDHYLPGYVKLLPFPDYQEDGDYWRGGRFYGHRYIRDAARLIVKGAAAQLLAPNIAGDSFLPDRQDGCLYEGHDKPGIDAHPGEEVHFHLWFRGGPVDACNGDKEIGDWKEWQIVCDRTPPKSVPDPGQQTKPGGKTSPKPYFGGLAGQAVTLIYESGLSRFVLADVTYPITLRFGSQGEIYRTTIKVYIDRIDKGVVYFHASTMTALNIAPSGHKPLLIQPGAPGAVPFKLLD